MLYSIQYSREALSVYSMLYSMLYNILYNLSIVLYDIMSYDVLYVNFKYYIWYTI